MRKSFLLILFMTLCFISVSSLSASELPDGFINIKKVIPNIQLEIRYFSNDNFVGEPIIGYNKPKCYLTKKAAIALQKVQLELNTFGLGLKVYDAYRPQQAVDHFVVWAKDISNTKMKHRYYPNVAKTNLFRDGYIAAKSGHSRGSTVDLTIISLHAQKELDMGTPWDFFSPQSWPESMAVTPAQRANRMLLKTLMTKHGFKSLKEEWWHFTLENEPYPNQYFNFPIE